MIDVLVATLGQRAPRGLAHVGEHNLIVDASAGWATAANRLLDQSTRDVLFIDDDIILTPHTFDAFRAVRDHADVFGFTLCQPGTEQVTSAGFVMLPGASGHLDMRPLYALGASTLFRPQYVAHVTASCLYIKREVIAAGVRFPVWPGQHHEDVAFTFDCWLHVFKVAYVPGLVYHELQSSTGAGATKSTLPTFEADRAINARHLAEWIAEHDIQGACRSGVIPIGALEVPA